MTRQISAVEVGRKPKPLSVAGDEDEDVGNRTWGWQRKRGRERGAASLASSASANGATQSAEAQTPRRLDGPSPSTLFCIDRWE